MYHNIKKTKKKQQQQTEQKTSQYYCSVYNIEKSVEQELLKYAWTYPRKTILPPTMIYIDH